MTLGASQMRVDMQEELGHSEDLQLRIFLLNGASEMKLTKPPARALSLQEMIKSDLVEEKKAIAFSTKVSLQDVENGDLLSREIFEQIALDEEQHMKWLELQLDLFKRVGEAEYVKTHSYSRCRLV